MPESKSTTRKPKKTAPKLPTTVVRRSKWVNGGNSIDSETAEHRGDSLLLNKRGFMCCLGFDAVRRGCKVSQIRGSGSPETAEIHTSGVDFGLLLDVDGCNSRVCLDLMNVNDDTDLSSKQREAKIRKIGVKAGIRFVFKP